MINFADYLDYYNYKNKSNVNVVEMLQRVYDELKSLRKGGMYFGVHYFVFRKALIKHKIEIQPRGGCHLSVFDGIDFEGKLVTEIAAEANSTARQVYSYANKRGIKYKKLKRGRPFKGGRENYD